MKIHGPDHTKTLVKPFEGGFVFDYAGQTNYMADEGGPAPSVGLVEHTLEKISFPVQSFPVEVFLFPYQLRRWSESYGWGASYHGQSYHTHIVLGVQPAEYLPSWFTHELGHVVQLLYVPDLTKYKELRGITWEEQYGYYHRPREIFAEDFRFLFGPPEAQVGSYEFYRRVNPPGEEIKEWFMSLEVDTVNNPQKIIIHHSLTDDNIILKDFNAIKRYHTQVKGWNDIGYHWVLEQVSNRYFWIPGRDEKTPGAHVKEQRMNYKSIGLCVVGNFDKDTPTKEIYQLVAEKCNEIRTRYPGIKVEDVEPHWKYATYKSCPGNNFDMDEVHKRMSKGKIITSDVAPFIKDGRTFLPARVLIEAAGGQVDWDAASQAVTCIINDRKIVMRIGSKEIVVHD